MWGELLHYADGGRRFLISAPALRGAMKLWVYTGSDDVQAGLSRVFVLDDVTTERTLDVQPGQWLFFALMNGSDSEETFVVRVTDLDPAITSVSPTPVEYGNTITISGRKFGEGGKVFVHEDQGISQSFLELPNCSWSPSVITCDMRPIGARRLPPGKTKFVVRRELPTKGEGASSFVLSRMSVLRDTRSIAVSLAVKNGAAINRLFTPAPALVCPSSAGTAGIRDTLILFEHSSLAWSGNTFTATFNTTNGRTAIDTNRWQLTDLVGSITGSMDSIGSSVQSLRVLLSKSSNNSDSGCSLTCSSFCLEEKIINFSASVEAPLVISPSAPLDNWLSGSTIGPVVFRAEDSTGLGVPTRSISLLDRVKRRTPPNPCQCTVVQDGFISNEGSGSAQVTLEFK